MCADFGFTPCVHQPSGKCVRSAPSAGDPQQLDPLNLLWDCGIYQQLSSHWFQSQHGTEKQQGSAGGPGLGTAGSRVLHGEVRFLPWVPGESFGKSVVKKPGSFEIAQRHDGCLFEKAVVSQSLCNK